MVDWYPTLFLKKEATYGTDAVPTAAANAFLTRNFTSTPMEVDQIERQLDNPTRGASPVAITNARQALAFELELAGSGTAGVAPPWMEALEFCGMEAPTLVATTSATQKFVGVGQAVSSATAYHWRGNQRRKGLGARGNISTIDFTAGAYPFIGFNMIAMLPAASPYDTVLPGAPDFSRFKDPVEVNTANTTVLLDGFAVKMRHFRVSANAQLGIRNLVGVNYVNRGNHALSGTMMVEAESTATKDFFQRLKAGTRLPLSIVHGTVPGHIVELTAGYVQITSIPESNEDDVLMQEFGILLTVNSGQDDLILRAK